MKLGLRSSPGVHAAQNTGLCLVTYTEGASSARSKAQIGTCSPIISCSLRRGHQGVRNGGQLVLWGLMLWISDDDPGTDSQEKWEEASLSPFLQRIVQILGLSYLMCDWPVHPKNGLGKIQFSRMI